MSFSRGSREECGWGALGGRGPAVPLFLSSPLDLGHRVKQYERELYQLLQPLRSLSPAEAHAVGAEKTVRALCRAWEANVAALRALLPSSPSLTLALPLPGAVVQSPPGAQQTPSWEAPPVEYADMHQLIAHIARDWSAWGADARRRTHTPVLNTIRAHSLRWHWSRGRSTASLRVLVPGAGGCRLAWEIARRGHHVEASDSSDGMLLAAHTIITSFRSPPARCANATWRPRAGRIRLAAQEPACELAWPLELFPFAPCGGGVLQRQACLQPAIVPDQPIEHACSHKVQLVLQSASFLSYYGVHEAGLAAWDAIVTSYFLDCLADPVAAVRRVSQLLVRGGLWINVGPLQWHVPSAGMLRLSWEELRALLGLHSFKLQRWRILRRVPYLSHPKMRWLLSASEHWHDVLFFVAIKE